MAERPGKFALRVLALALVLYALYSVDWLGLRLNDEVTRAPAVLGLVALLHAGVLSLAVAGARWRGWPLVAALFLLVYDVTAIAVAIEAVYLPDTLPPALALSLVSNGAVVSAVSAIAAVWLFGRLGTEPAAEAGPPRAWWSYLWRLLVLGLLYAVLFVAFGALVFMPIAGQLAPEALEVYTTVDLPAWVLPFQVGRGVLWALLVLPMVRALRGPRWRVALTMGLLFAVLMGANLLRPAGIDPGLLTAHLIEVTGANLLYGLAVGGLLYAGSRAPR